MTTMRDAVKNIPMSITMNIMTTTRVAAAKNMRIITNMRSTVVVTNIMNIRAVAVKNIRTSIMTTSRAAAAMTTMIMKTGAVVAAADMTIPMRRIRTKERCCWVVGYCLPQA